jgi:3-hydroxybutyryl-CoA dehydrogenase
MKMTRPVIAIMGIGQMGAAAAAFFGRAGYPVLAWARDRTKLDGLPSRLANLYEFLDEHGMMAADRSPEVVRATELDQIVDEADFVLECIAEDVAQKAELLRQLQGAAARGAVIASCTSGLSITEIGRHSGVGRRLVGAHFWNPPHLMPLVEVIRGADTDEGLVEYVAQLLRDVGKRPVMCKDVPGFIGNRLLHAMWREAIHLVQEGVCTAEDVDLVTKLTFALRMPAVGPFENMDLVGINLVARIQSYLLSDLSCADSTMPLLKDLQSRQHLGMVAGRGFYDWTSRDPDQLIELRDEQIVRQLAFLRSRSM